MSFPAANGWWMGVCSMYVVYTLRRHTCRVAEKLSSLENRSVVVFLIEFWRRRTRIFFPRSCVFCYAVYVTTHRRTTRIRFFLFLMKLWRWINVKKCVKSARSCIHLNVLYDKTSKRKIKIKRRAPKVTVQVPGAHVFETFRSTLLTILNTHTAKRARLGFPHKVTYYIICIRRVYARNRSGIVVPRFYLAAALLWSVRCTFGNPFDAFISVQSQIRHLVQRDGGKTKLLCYSSLTRICRTVQK